jgi:hypothetical protein
MVARMREKPGGDTIEVTKGDMPGVATGRRGDDDRQRFLAPGPA